MEHLSLTKNDFHVIKTDAFQGLKSLRRLTLDGNNISIIKPFAFRGLSRLREISIRNTPLQKISEFSFAGLQNVTRINLSYNKIKKVEGYAFAGTSNVQMLMLNNNPMLRVETAAFSGLTNVEFLNFPSGIKLIEPDSFKGMDTVGLLKLAYMDLNELGPNTFRGLSKVHVLSIQESDLGVIKEGAFSGLSQVSSLNILNNKIDGIEELVLKPGNRVGNLRLHGNHLLESPAAGTVVIEGVRFLSVQGNHFPCDCHLHTLLQSPLANTSDFPSKNFCISPLEVNGKPIASLDLDSIGRCQEQVTKENLEASNVPSDSNRCYRNQLDTITLLVWLFSVLMSR